jgi:hypothetical protein
MQEQLPTSEIQATTYKSLGKMFQNLLIKYSSRQQITYGMFMPIQEKFLQI